MIFHLRGLEPAVAETSDNIKPVLPTVAIFVLLILAVFVMEISLEKLLLPYFSSLSRFNASVAHAAVMTLFYSVPFWGIFVRPLFAVTNDNRANLRASIAFLIKAMALIFLVELFVIFYLPQLFPGVDDDLRAVVDAGLNILICAPLLWLFLVGKESQSRGVRIADMLETPVKLYIMLLFVVFLGDFTESLVLPNLLPYEDTLVHKLVDNFLFTMISAPFLWWLIMRPLHHTALCEKARSEKIQAQVMDAVMSVDAKGIIESFNPVAERIFGYSADEVKGKNAAEFLCEDRQFLAEMIRNSDGQSGEGELILSNEVPVRRRDGATLVMDASLSRLILGGRPSFLMIMRDITGRKAMEKALRESEERFNFALNGSNDGIWDWNVGTGEIYYSPRLRELLGYEEREMGSDFKSFDGLLHPDDHDRAMAEVQAHLKTRLPFDTEYRLRTKSGDYRWFCARGRAVWDDSGMPLRMAGSISDITPRKETETALNETLLRLRQIFEYTEDAIFFFRPGTCEVIDVNHSAELLYGYTKEELLTMPLESLCSPDHFLLLKNSICNIRQGELSPLDNIINIRKDGTEINVSMRGKVISLQGVDTVYCTFRDVTERIRLENESREIQANLIQANKMTSLGLMVSGVAHEINNPNNFIMANIQFINNAWGDAIKVLREYYSENGDFLIAGLPFSELEVQSPQIFTGITDGVRRINEIVQTLKRFARQELPASDQCVDINETVNAAISILHHEIVKYTENFHLELGDDIPYVMGNGQQLGQVFINLLMNACQSLPSREQGVWIATGYDPERAAVTISIRDEGGGIPEELAGRIMEPFFTTKLDRGGTGLGLTISQSIIKDHNGSLEYDTERGKGTVFTVRIPAAETMGKGIYSEAS